MNDVEFQLLLETALRRPLTADEQTRLRACLAENPSTQALWEEEMALSRLLDQLPDAPLASNFTAQVLRAVEREGRQSRRGPKAFRWLGLRRPAQLWAAAGLALVLIASGYRQYQSARRGTIALALAKLAAGIDTPSKVVALAPDELWNNFDAIDQLPQPQADQDLLAVLKEVAMK
jgi:anti-sigma factor RsiW